LLLSVLDAEERDTKTKEKLDELARAISNNKLSEAQSLLEKLRNMIEGEPPELVLAQARIERRQRRGVESRNILPKDQHHPVL
jgi:hypothetical protein